MEMEIDFNPGNVCKIVDVGKGDNLYANRKKLIGQKVIFSSFGNGRYPEGFLGCNVIFKKAAPPSIVAGQKVFFFQVKLEKINTRLKKQQKTRGRKTLASFPFINKFKYPSFLLFSRASG